MENPYLLPIVLQIIGVAIIAIEVVIPSGGLLSLLAIVIFGYSLYEVFTNLSMTAGLIFVAADLVIIPVLIYVGFKILAKTPVMLRKNLSSKEGVKAQKVGLSDYVGKQGVTITDLRPSGIVKIDKKRLDAVTEGKYLDKDSSIVVTAVLGGQLVVRKTQ